jgi:hypothetical protein
MLNSRSLASKFFESGNVINKVVNYGSTHISKTLWLVDTPIFKNILMKPQNYLSRLRNQGKLFKINLLQLKAPHDK